MSLREKCERIWESYKLFASTAFVARKGFELVGLTRGTDLPLPVVETFERRGESGLEHQAKVAWLAVAFAENFPMFFGEMPLGPSYELFYKMIVVELCHDVGEVATGDIPDDGNALHGTKDEREREVVASLMQVFRHNDKCLTEMFQEFQNKNTRAGQALYALDKIEAVLTLIFLEQYEHYGAMNEKPSVTEQDRHFMKLTHTSCATDCWAAHVKAPIQDYSEEIVGPVFELLRVAVEDVRGGMFEWWDDEILPYGD